MNNKPILMNADEVASILGINMPEAYKIIRAANEKLAAAGKIVVRGKLNRNYFNRLTDVSDIN